MKYHLWWLSFLGEFVFPSQPEPSNSHLTLHLSLHVTGISLHKMLIKPRGITGKPASLVRRRLFWMRAGAAPASVPVLPVTFFDDLHGFSARHAELKLYPV
jgi:hypothetical protein